jgi:hypothetical protein
MPFVEYGGLRVLFVHIPRTGGTTIEHWMSTLGELRCHAPIMSAALKCMPQHLRALDIESIFGPGFFDYAFAIVRNPYSRIASEYRLRAVLRKGNFFGEGPPSFPQWLDHCLGIYQRNNFHLDNHLRPQWDFLDDRTEVFRFEDGLPSIVARIAERLNAPAPSEIDHKARTSEHPYKTVFGPAEVEKIRHLYRGDFERFEYDLDPPPEFSGAA